MIKRKEGFKGERFISLPEEILVRYGDDPLTGNLYLRKIGFFPKVKYHYVQKKKGADYATLLYCTDGKGWYSIQGKQYEIKENQYIIIPPHTPYAFGANEKEPWTLYWLHFRGKLTPLFLPSNPVPVSILPCEYSRVQERIDLFEEIYRCFSHGYIREYMIYTSMCLYPFLASFLWVKQYRHSQASNLKEYPLSSRIIHYMEENLEKNLSLDQFAAFFNLSPSHFSLLFHKETGVSPINYFIRLKIQKACQHIALTNLKISEIALKAGYEDPAYFTRVFTRIMGLSPSAYRKSPM